MGFVFNQIPNAIYVPGQYIEFQPFQLNSALPAMPSRILVFGQMLPSGSWQPNTPAQIFGPSQAIKYFGRGSMLANMLVAILNANSFTELWACAQADNQAGQPAIGSVTFPSAAQGSGTGTLYVAANSVPSGVSTVQIGITSGMTAPQMATALAAAINGMPDLPVTAAVDAQNTAKVDLTCRHAGIFGNDIDLRTSYYTGDAPPAGVAMQITPMAGGSGNPMLQASIASLGNRWYTTLICPYYDGASTTAMNAELARRFGPLVQQDCQAFICYPGATSIATSFGVTQDSQFQCVIGSHLSPTHPSLWSGILGSVCEYSAAIDPARPFQTLALPGLLGPATADQAAWQDREDLLTDGISTYLPNPDGTVAIERIVTSYLTDVNGLPDTTYQDAEAARTIAYLRYSQRLRIAQKFPRCKLADDDTPAARGSNIVGPKKIRNELLALGYDWQGAGLITNISLLKSGLAVQRNATDRDRADALTPLQIVKQFRTFAGQIQFAQ